VTPAKWAEWKAWNGARVVHVNGQLGTVEAVHAPEIREYNATEPTMWVRTDDGVLRHWPAAVIKKAPRWGRLLNRWHDETGAFHILKEDNSPACGARYFASTGTYPMLPQESQKCRRCAAKEVSR